MTAKRAKRSARQPCSHCGFLDGKQVGRRGVTKLTQSLQDAVERMLLHGNYLETAALANGVSRHLLLDWRKRAEAGAEPYAGFWDTVERAMARAEADMVETLKSTGADPKGAASGARCIEWLLERTRRGRFGPSLKVEVEEAKETLLDVCQRVLAPGDFALVIAALEDDGPALPREARLGSG